MLFICCSECEFQVREHDGKARVEFHGSQVEPDIFLDVKNNARLSENFQIGIEPRIARGVVPGSCLYTFEISA